MPSSTHTRDQSYISHFSGEQLQDFATYVHVGHFVSVWALADSGRRPLDPGGLTSTSCVGLMR